MESLWQQLLEFNFEMLSLFCLVEVIWKKYFLTIYLLLLFVFSGGLVISAQWMVAGYEILQNLLYGKTTVQIYQKQSNGLTRLYPNAKNLLIENLRSLDVLYITQSILQNIYTCSLLSLSFGLKKCLEYVWWHVQCKIISSVTGT